MAFDKIVDSAALNARLTAIADSIRAKGETTEGLCFEKGDYEKAINAIQLGFFPTLNVTAPAGSNVTVTDGATTLAGVGTGAPIPFKLTAIGTWTIRATQNSDVAEKVVVVSDITMYSVELKFHARISTLPPGRLVRMKINGEAWEWLVVHQGIPSSLYNAECNGTWLLLKDIYATRRWSSGSRDYERSEIHAYLNGEFFDYLDAHIRSAVKQVRIPYRPGDGDDENISSGDKGLPTKVFLLSCFELGYDDTSGHYIPNDGSKLDYFSAGNTADANQKRCAKLNGRITRYWVRSPVCSSAYRDYAYGSDGGSANVSECYNKSGIRPALVLSPNMKVDDSGNVIN